MALKSVLQGSVSEHDSVEGQGSGDGLLLNKLYEGETRWLSLIASHPHKLYVPHLLEELQQLLCCGGLCKKKQKNFVFSGAARSVVTGFICDFS